MAKSESTAVNALIDMVRSGKPAASEAADDLFGGHPPWMTSTIAPTAAEIAPLPRNRAPTGTSQHVVDKQVRMTTAPPRTNTIPPLPQARGAKAQPLPDRASRPSPHAVPPPRPSSQAVPPPRPSQPPEGAAAPRTARASQQMPAVRAPDAAARPRRPSPSPDARARAASPSPDALARARAASPPPDALARARAASPSPETIAAAQQLPRAASPDVARAATPPAPRRTTGTQRATGAQRTTPPKTSPVAAPFEQPHPMIAIAQQARLSTIDRTGDVVSAENWFEASRAVEKVDETWVGTHPGERRTSAAATAKKVLVPLVALAVVGFGVGYLVFHSAAGHKKPAPHTAHVTAPAPVAAPPSAAAAAVAAPAPAAAPAATPAPATPSVPPAGVKAIADSSPVVQEVHIAHGVVKLVDIRINSSPAGATVMLVDNGKTTLLGTTPVAASVDPSRSYDVVLTLEGRPTQMTHFDPAKTQRLDVTLAKAAPVAKAAPAVRAAPAQHAETPHRAPAKKAASAPAGGLVDPGFDAPKAEVGKADKAEGGNGTLMVSSKPPCNIWIDGNDTGLTTPQRSISLAAGMHKVTFVNTAENITKTVTVKITADQSTKLIQDLMSH
jgi:hypothetical protein